MRIHATSCKRMQILRKRIQTCARECKLMRTSMGTTSWVQRFLNKITSPSADPRNSRPPSPDKINVPTPDHGGGGGEPYLSPRK